MAVMIVVVEACLRLEQRRGVEWVAGADREDDDPESQTLHDLTSLMLYHRHSCHQPERPLSLRRLLEQQRQENGLKTYLKS